MSVLFVLAIKPALAAFYRSAAPHLDSACAYGVKLATRARMRILLCRLRLVCLIAPAVLSAGCASLFEQTSSTGAAVAGSAAAASVTHDAAVATGIGVGVETLASRGVRLVERSIHAEEQSAIAQAAGPLAPDEVAPWHVHHVFALEADEQGQVSVTREVSALGQLCKEIVFTVESGESQAPGAFVAQVCSVGSGNAAHWVWALAEPSTARWGVLQ